MANGRAPLICACLLFALGPELAAEPFRHIGPEEGLSHPNVYAIVEDDEGFLWFATQDGIDRFDGSGFSTPGAGFASIDASWLARSRQGVIWIGTWGQGLERFDPRAGTVHRYVHDPDDPTSLADNRIHSTFEDREGRLWVATYRGLDLYRPGGTFVHVEGLALAPGGEARRVWRVSQDLEGALWVGTEGGVGRYDPGGRTWTWLRHDPSDPTSLDDDRVRTLAHDEGGRLWVGTETGLERFDSVETGFRRYRHDPDDPTSLPSDQINTLYQEPGGSLWIGTSQGGLARYLPEIDGFESFGTADGFLPSDDVRAVLVDRTGLVWIGTRYGGVAVLDRAPVRFEHLLAGESITDLVETRDGTLWIGALDRLLSLELDAPEAATRTYDAGPGGLSHPSVKALAEDASGRLWVGTFEGLDRFVPGQDRLERVPVPGTGPGSQRIEALVVDTRDRVWVGTHQGLYRHDAGSDRVVEAIDPGRLTDDYIRCLEADDDGGLWVGTDVGGVTWIAPDGVTVRHYPHNPGQPSSLSSRRVYDIRRARDGRLWVATANGLDELDRERGRVRRFGLAEGLPNTKVKSILDDPEGFLWVTSNGGLSRLDPETGEILTFSTRDGLQGLFFTDAKAVSRSGAFLFGGSNGLTRFVPSAIRPDRTPPPIALTGLTIGERPTPHHLLPRVDEIVIEPGDRTFSVELAVLELRDPHRARMSYRLDDYDRGWIEAPPERVVRYTDVPPGRYLFRARAATSHGIWSATPYALRVVVRPPVWRTSWFRILGGAFLLAGVVSVHRLRLHRLRLEARRLEREVAVRTAELTEHQAEITRKSRQLSIVNTTIRLINQETSLSDLLPAILEGVSFVERADWAVALVRQGTSDRFAVAAAFSGRGGECPREAMVREEIEARYLATAREITPGVHLGRPATPDPIALEVTLGGRPQAVLVMVVPVREELTAYLVFGSLRDWAAFSEGDRESLENLRGHLVSAFVKGRLLADLEELNAKKDEFLGMAAHDLRSPLGGVKSTTDLLLRLVEENRFDPAIWRRFLENIRSSATQMHGLVNDLLDVAAVEMGRIEVHPSRQSMASRLASRLPLFETPAEVKRIAIEVDLGSAGVDIFADPARVDEILDNLISNAIKYTHPGGRVRIWCETREDEVVTRIADSGQGLPPEELDRVFAGTRLSARPTGGERSTGLGLVIVKKLVELQGGRVEVESVLGEGSTFSFALPRSEAEGSAAG